LVAVTAFSAVWTAASALYTAPCAEAMLPGEGVLVVVVVFAALEEPLPDPFEEELPEPLEPRLPEPEPDPDPDPEDDDVVVGWLEPGPIVVTVLIVVIVVVVPDPDFGFLDLPEAPGLNEAYSTVPELAPVRLVSLAVPVVELDPDEPDEPEDPEPDPHSEVSPWRQARLSCAAVRLSLAWSSESCAAVGSRSARS
jgi:hypothetical protein